MLRIHLLAVLAIFAAERAIPLSSAGSLDDAELPDCLCNKREPCSLPSPLPEPKEDYHYVEGLSAYKLYNEAQTWDEARRICEEDEGHLAIVNSEEEAKALVSLMKKFKNVIGSWYPQTLMLGFHRRCDPKILQTMDGRSVKDAGYDKWADTEPNNLFNRQDCGSIDVTGRLHDIDGSMKLGFICEIPIAPKTQDEP